MPINQGTPLVLGAGTQPQGAQPIQAMDQYGTSAVAAAHDQFAFQTLQGNMYTYTSLSQVPISSTTAPSLTLWNPANSGVNCVLVRYLAGLAGTPDVATDIVLMMAKSAGANIGTGAAFTAFTNVVASNCLINYGKSARALVATTSTITAAAFTLFTSLGLSQLTTTAAQLNVPWFMGDIWFRGTIILTPGTAVFDAGTAATNANHRRNLYWYEVPV